MSNPTELPDLDRLEALARAATPGPWELLPVVDRRISHLCPVDQDKLSLLTAVHQDDTPFGAVYKDSDAEFIAAANPAAVLALIALTRRPPVPALRPTDDELWDSTIRDRDTYHEWADKLAGAIAIHFGVDIGEHSNQNCPWHEALEAIESAEPDRRAQPEGEAPQAVYPSNEIMAEICEVAGYANLSMQQIREVFDRHAPAAQHAESGAQAADEQRRCEQENAEFTEWWRDSGQGADPAHTLITENAAHATWQERARRAALTAQSQGAQAVPQWGRVQTVGDMVRNLLTLDQAEPIFSAFHVDFDGARRCRTSPISISHERVIDGKWVDSTRKDVPYATVVWAKPDERAQQAAAPGAQKWTAMEIADACVKAGLGILECHGLIVTLKGGAPGTPEAPQTAAARDVLAERLRQVEVEGWTPASDDEYVDGQLASAAVAYAQAYTPYLVPSSWPWAVEWFKPADDRRNLVKAGALIVAEIERLDRAAQLDGGQGEGEKA